MRSALDWNRSSISRLENITNKNYTNNERPDSDTRHSLATLNFKAQWLLYVPPGGTVVFATLRIYVFCKDLGRNLPTQY